MGDSTNGTLTRVELLDGGMRELWMIARCLMDEHELMKLNELREVRNEYEANELRMYMESEFRLISLMASDDEFEAFREWRKRRDSGIWRRIVEAIGLG